eukprot:3749918-Amphidinium_carterae.1
METCCFGSQLYAIQSLMSMTTRSEGGIILGRSALALLTTVDIPNWSRGPPQLTTICACYSASRSRFHSTRWLLVRKRCHVGIYHDM